MIVEFLVTNYRSFSNEQIISLIPVEKDNSLSENNLFKADSGQKVICAAAIYGANAAGKSNLIKAMHVMRMIIKDSSTKVQAGQKLNIQPFAYPHEKNDKPTAFELSLLIDGIRFQYGFSLTPEKIIDEWLFVYKAFKPQKWFERKWNPEKNEYNYEFSVSFLGQKELWKQATRDNALFFSTAIQFNSEQLRPLWDCIINNWRILPAQAQINLYPTISAIEKNQDKGRILEFLNAADLGIKDVEIVTQKGRQAAVGLEAASGKFVVSPTTDMELKIPKLKHSSPAGEAVFDLGDESNGTQKLLAFSGLILSVLDNGATLVVDELEDSMHPLLVRHILGLFLDKKTNPHGAQIIFSTHNTSLLDNELLRRDQIWFIEKDHNQASILTPLTEFSARKHEAFEKAYLEGRYGSLPILKSFRLGKTAND